MQDHVRSKWDKWYLEEESDLADVKYDPWIFLHTSPFALKGNERILDLGCGRGYDSQYLEKLGKKIITADYSGGALTRSRRLLNNPCPVQFDMRDGFPFTKLSFKLIVANLSLHYFSKILTEKIIHEMGVLIMDEGCLVARVNSKKDHGFISASTNYESVIEEDFFIYQGIPRRFFDKDSLEELFANGWEILFLEEKKIDRYEKPKVLWEIIARKDHS